MSWLKRIQPVTLYQSSDLPYVILDDGIHLCSNNLFLEEPDEGAYKICITANKHDLFRQSTYSYKFLSFPTIIPFDSVINCDETIIEGRYIKSSIDADNDSIHAILIKDGYISEIADNQFQDIIDQIESSDHAFLLTDKDTLDPQSRLLSDITQYLYHTEWGRTCLAISHAICPKPDRKYCWTQSIPEFHLTCFGLENDDMQQIQDTFDFMGLQHSVVWEE